MGHEPDRRGIGEMLFMYHLLARGSVTADDGLSWKSCTYACPALASGGRCFPRLLYLPFFGWDVDFDRNLGCRAVMVEKYTHEFNSTPAPSPIDK